MRGCPLNLMALRQLAGQPIDEKERQNLITDLYHREVGYRQRIDLQLEQEQVAAEGQVTCNLLVRWQLLKDSYENRQPDYPARRQHPADARLPDHSIDGVSHSQVDNAPVRIMQRFRTILIDPPWPSSKTAFYQSRRKIKDDSS